MGGILQLKVISSTTNIENCESTRYGIQGGRQEDCAINKNSPTKRNLVTQLLINSGQLKKKSGTTSITFHITYVYNVTSHIIHTSHITSIMLEKYI